MVMCRLRRVVFRVAHDLEQNVVMCIVLAEESGVQSCT